MTIKAKLTIAVVVLVAASAAILGYAVVTASRSSGLAQIDAQLQATAVRQPAPRRPGRVPEGSLVGPSAALGEDRYRTTAEVLFERDGSVEYATAAGFPDDPEPLPAVPAPGSDRYAALKSGPVTIPSVEGAPSYRAVIVPQGDGEDLLLAVSLADLDATTEDLLRTVLLTAAAVLALGALSSWLIIRRALRPVDDMIDTAAAIGAGDLSQRVDHPADGTELGRLAHALDDMLAQIDAAFAEREAGEARLRRFVGDASHELRTPVAVVRGYAELYRSGGLPPGEKLDGAMGRIESESERMGRLVEDLLVLARLDQHQPLQLDEVDLAGLAADAVADTGAVDAGRPVDLAVEPGADTTLVGDEHKLRQVLANLLANARVHTPVGTPVHVGLSGGPDEVVLVVADEGPGIPAEHRAKVFERFYRADESRSRDTGGSGLGLSIVAAVVAAHGGTVEVASAPGEGAAFRVRLPRRPAPTAPSAPSEPEPAPAPAS